MTTSQTEDLTNGNFGAPGTGPTTLTQPGAGDSAAPGWTTFNVVDGVTTTTELVPSTLPDHSQMLHVTTTAPRCGLVQQFLPQRQGPTSAHLEVMVFVLDGQVGIGIGDGGDTSVTTFSTTTGQWETLEADHFVTNAGEVVIFGAAGNGGSYFVGNASVTEPAGDGNG
jgi:hypothetical protein